MRASPCGEKNVEAGSGAAAPAGLRQVLARPDPSLSSRWHLWAGNQPRSMRMTRHCCPRGSSSVKKRTVARSPSARAVTTRSKSVERVHRLAVNALDHRSARHGDRAKYIAGIGDIDAAHRHVEVSRLLVRQLVDDGLAKLDVARWSDRVQVLHLQLHVDRLASALRLDRARGCPRFHPAPDRADRIPQSACRSDAR